MTTLVDRTLTKTGYRNRSAIERVVELTVEALERQLCAVGQDLASILPEAETVRPTEAGLPQTPEPLYAAVAAEIGARPGVALELVQTVVAEVFARVPAARRQELRSALPLQWAALIVEPRAPSIQRPAPRQVAAPGFGRTLATGRPGSERPLADARPGGGQADSVAETDDPHADDRLSSAHGSRTEQRDETLAAGRPGRGGRPVSGSD